MKQYDYIICGAGAAGLSLLMHLMQNKAFDDKTILVIDKAIKNSNDRTWCFWEQQPGIFEPIVHHSWQQAHFYSAYYSGLIHLQPYTYKMIRGIDFYNYVLNEASARSNISFITGNVQALANEVNNARVLVDGESYTANYLFNSIILNKPPIPANKYFLLQHFKGWLIETADPVFKDAHATLMDFRVSQHNGTTFVYVLPLSPNKALVEYTLFTGNTLGMQVYDTALKDYIAQYLSIADYRVVEEEYGIIPMTNINFPRNEGRIINIGTAGGQTKASSGYTFNFIQKHIRSIVQLLLYNQYPLAEDSFFDRRFKLYDSTLLNILHNKKLGGDRIFADLFKKNEPGRVLRFLDNESSLKDEINIMGSLPSQVFMKAALQEIFR
ncbi:MAG: hypothetical protein LH478_01420 [Chitinophagaceae bacterium]|nr:hypothetical protein [Chitinophagaceae bacterium]